MAFTRNTQYDAYQRLHNVVTELITKIPQYDVAYAMQQVLWDMRDKMNAEQRLSNKIWECKQHNS